MFGQMMFLDASNTMLLAQVIFVIALVGGGTWFGVHKYQKKKRSKGSGVKLVLKQEGEQKTLDIDLPATGMYEYERGERDTLPIYLDPKYAHYDRTTGERYFYACERTGLQYHYVSPHPKDDEEASMWAGMALVSKIIDGGLVDRFVKSWEPAWWEGLVKYIPYVVIVAALFSLPMIIGEMKNAMSFIPVLLGWW